MAQTGYTPILIYSSSTAAAAPIAGNLTNSTLGSELAINITDGKLFYKDNANAVQVIGWKVVPTSAGGTGLSGATPFTANGILFASSASALSTSSALTWNGSTLATTGALTVDGNATLGNATTDTVTVNGYMGVGGAASASRGVYVQSTALTGTTQSGVVSALTGSSAATSNIDAFRASPASAAASFTVANMSGVRITDATKGAGSTISSQYGILIDDQTQGTSNFGISSQVTSGTNKWNIYASGTAANYFAGQAQFANGAVGTPSISNINDTNTGIFFPAADTVAIATNGTEDIRFFASGGVSIGNTTDPGAGNLRLAAATANFVRLTTTTAASGTCTTYYDVSNNFSGVSQSFVQGIGPGNSGVSQLSFGVATTSGATTATDVARFDTGGNFRPSADNTYSNGTGALRWSVIYAATGTINTSDGTTKTVIGSMDAVEERVAQRIKSNIKKFKFNDAIAKKGDDARIHWGVVAQDVYDAFAQEGLNAERYGMFCSDSWFEKDGVKVLDDNGEIMRDGECPEGATKITRLGVRYEELLTFVIASM